MDFPDQPNEPWRSAMLNLLDDIKLIAGGALVTHCGAVTFGLIERESWAAAMIGAIFVVCILPIIRMDR